MTVEFENCKEIEAYLRGNSFITKLISGYTKYENYPVVLYSLAFHQEAKWTITFDTSTERANNSRNQGP